MLTALMLVLAAVPPRVAILSTAGETTTLRFQRVGATELAPIACELRHADGSSVLGALAGDIVLATATTAPRGDLSFASSLFRLEATGPTELVDRVALSSRPVVMDGKRVFVQRGRMGTGRIDELTIDEVDLSSAATRTVYAARGYVTFIAGVLGRELVIYEVTPEGARLLAVQVDTLSTRVLRATLPPLAHDFVVDPVGRRVLYALGTSRDSYSLEETSLDTSMTRSLARAPHVAMLPAVAPDGRVLFAKAPGQGLHVAGSEKKALSANGAGYERVRFFFDGLAIGLHELPSDFPRAFAVRLKDGAQLGFVTPAHTRLEVAGVLP